jgi:class 3 adenylate cyclase
MGDTINTASRLEGSTKESDFYVLLADSTRAALLAGAGGLVPAGEVDVRGRQTRVTVWSVEDARKPGTAVPAPVVTPLEAYARRRANLAS